MRPLPPNATTLIVAATLSGCSTLPHNSDARPPNVLNNSTTVAVAPANDIQPYEAARLAKQATFGPTLDLVDEIVAKKSAASWIDDQLALSISTYADIANKPVKANFCESMAGTELTKCNFGNFTSLPMQMRFYANAISKKDQLRQRVAFALSQIVVASEVKTHSTAGLATFQQILLLNSLGNYREIIKDTMLNPYMGDYLDLADSDKDHPSENYARELLQLFSLGTVLLNPDGTPQVNDLGSTIPSYSNTDIKEIARALTGWTYARLNGAPLTDSASRDWSKPMVANASRFDAGQKAFLGKVVPANSSQQDNIDAVVDATFNHPNTAPFVCRRLIQQLIAANPSPAYVGRVAAVFADNGHGVRGDMKAVVRAIYLDNEARSVSQQSGKVKEPVLLLTALARAIGYTSDGYAFTTRDYGLGQAPFRAPSVFSFYPYDFPLPQGGDLISPASKLINTYTAIMRHNFSYNWTINGDGNRDDFKFQPTIPASIGTNPHWETWEANGCNDGKTIDRINLLMLNGTMTIKQRQALATAMTSYKNNDVALQARRRAQTALYIVASSPLFQVDR